MRSRRIVVLLAGLCCAAVDASQVLPSVEGAAPGPNFPQTLEGLAPGAKGLSTVTPRDATLGQQDGGYVINPTSRDEVRLFYKTVFGSTAGVASGWSGDIGTCNAGDTSSAYKAAIVRRINWFRAMAGVPAAIQLDPGFNAKAQQAAMLMSANRQLSHSPPSNWACFNAAGFEAAGKSNLSLGNAGGDAVTDGYMRDPGASNNLVGHRRWLLYPQTQFMGSGDVVGASGFMSSNALWVMDSNVFSGRPSVRDDFVAWPTRGFSPYQVVYPRWSFSYPKADFSAATVSMTENGVPISTRLEPVVNGFGENTLAWLPGAYTDSMRWARPTGDVPYQVTVGNVFVNGQARSFSYTVTVFDPDQDTPGAAPLTLIGKDAAAVGQVVDFSFGTVPGATGYQWRSVLAQARNLDDGAESGLGNFVTTSSAGYSIITTDVRASGSSAFHLAHTTPTDQVLQLKSALVGSGAALIRFASRLGLATSDQRALVEASVDEGKSWVVLFEQAGQSASGSASGEPAFTVRQVSLAQYANRSILLRFRYAQPSGSFFPQASNGVGWYLDDIHLEGVDVVSGVGALQTVTGNSFNLVPTEAGTLLLQARPGMHGFFSEWSGLKRVSVSASTVDLRDCVLDWAEKTFPTLLLPKAVSQSREPYYFRFYGSTNVYLGFSSSDDHLYYLDSRGLQDVGTKTQWASTANCK
jgi:uncharacterized protein YkwD